MSLRRPPAAERRRPGVPLAAQPEVVRLVRDLTLAVFVAGVLCATFTRLDQPGGPRPDGLVMELASDAESAWPDDPEVEAALVEVWGARSAEAARVAFCESSFRPDVVSDDGEDWGLFQVNDVHQPLVGELGYVWYDLLDPRVNSVVAKRIYERAGDWSPWTCGWAAQP